MGARRAGDLQAGPMQSRVNWALLGLVIERSSYAYELAQRFERTYEGVLSLSSISHVYTALGALKTRQLVEELPGTREGRQPKPRYRATEKGMREYREWLLGQVGEERRRQRLLMMQLVVLARDPQGGAEIVDDYERESLAEAITIPMPRMDREAPTGDCNLSSRLVAEEDRLAVGARLAWVQFARQELARLADLRGRRG